MRHFAALLALAIVATIGALPCKADDYPSRPVEIIVPFGAGGPTDVYTRAIAEELRKSLHQTFVMENKPAPAPPSEPTTSPRPRPMATRC